MRITFKGNGVVFDAARGKNLCKFEGGKYENGVWVQGLFTTDNPRTIELLKDYPTVPPGDMKLYWAEKETAEESPRKPFVDYTIKELRAYAKEHDIDLGDAKKKDDILAVLSK